MAKPSTLAELAALVGGQLEGDSGLVITGLNGIEFAGPNEITFIQHRKQTGLLAETEASACIVPQDAEGVPLPHIRVGKPDVAAAKIHQHLLASPFVAAGIHASAVVGSDCEIPEAVTIGALVSIGDRVRLGERVTIEPGVVIGNDSVIGNDTVLHANVTVAERCIIGNRVVLHHGAVIGSDGFGFATDESGRHYTKPQVGTVRIDDDVQIGACTCVDRAAFGTTWIKAGTRIDNQVQVGHNVVIGEGSVLVAQAGIAGSTTLGRGVVLGAKVGIAGHLQIEDRVMVAAMGGVHNNQPKGAVLGGLPAVDVKLWGRAVAAYNRLPDMVRELRHLRKEVDRLSSLVQQLNPNSKEKQ